MTKRLFYTFSGILAAGVIVLSSYIAMGMTRPAPKAQNDVVELSAQQGVTSQKQNKLNQKAEDTAQKITADSAFFDDLFDDDFFALRADPFEQIELMHKRAVQDLSAVQKTLFDTSWQNWFDGRFNMDEYKTDIKTKGNKIILTVQIPNLEEGTSNVDVNKDRIKISFTVAKKEEKTSKTEASVSNFKHSYLKIMPVPQEADAASAVTKTEKDKITVTFNKK